MFDFTTWTNVLKDTAESAGKKAGEVLEVTKMRVQLAQQKAELSKAYEKLGAMVYDMMKNEVDDSSAVDVCVDEIDFILSKIQEMEFKVNELKKVSICPSCGAEVSVDAFFCSKCGAKIERFEQTESDGTCCDASVESEEVMEDTAETETCDDETAQPEETETSSECCAAEDSEQSLDEEKQPE